MSRVLDLDVFAPSEETVKYKGKEYKVLPVRVEPLLRVIKSVQDIQDLGGKSNDEAIRASKEAMANILDFIAKNVPELPTNDLSLGEIVALIQFMTESAQDNAQKAIKPVAEPQKKTETPESGSPTT